MEKDNGRKLYLWPWVAKIFCLSPEKESEPDEEMPVRENVTRVSRVKKTTNTHRKLDHRNRWLNGARGVGLKPFHNSICIVSLSVIIRLSNCPILCSSLMEKKNQSSFVLEADMNEWHAKWRRSTWAILCTDRVPCGRRITWSQQHSCVTVETVSGVRSRMFIYLLLQLANYSL